MFLISEITKPLENSNPAGDDLAEKGGLLELEALAKPVAPTTEDGKRIHGDEVQCEPDWAKVSAHAETLLKRSKDLRVLAFYTAALLRTNGFNGFATGLKLIAELLCNCPFQSYPLINDSDPGSHIERWFTINSLSARYNQDGDPLRVIEGVRNTSLVKSKAGGFAYKDILNADQASQRLVNIRETWQRLDQQDRNEVIESIQAASAATTIIDKYITEHTPERVIPPDSPPTALHLLKIELQGLYAFIAPTAVKSAASDGHIEPLHDTDQTKNEQSGVSSIIRDRADAIRQLNIISDFFKKSEPTNPAPFFIQRTIQLLDKDFLTLLVELAPDSLSRFQMMAGLEKKDSQNSN